MNVPWKFVHSVSIYILLLFLFLFFRCTQIKTYSWDNAQVILVGNKCDMEDERVISTDKGKQLADQLGKYSYHLKSVTNQAIQVIYRNRCLLFVIEQHFRFPWGNCQKHLEKSFLIQGGGRTPCLIQAFSFSLRKLLNFSISSKFGHFWDNQCDFKTHYNRFHLNPQITCHENNKACSMCVCVTAMHWVLLNSSMMNQYFAKLSTRERVILSMTHII